MIGIIQHMLGVNGDSQTSDSLLVLLVASES